MTIFLYSLFIYQYVVQAVIPFIRGVVSHSFYLFSLDYPVLTGIGQIYRENEETCWFSVVWVD